ncbi:hypothetical protein [Ferrimicrobium acidiphilum]|jgi:hypothetical protein|uniref:hypothetical protein n=1 Tax=Ferrimicrobium acidiphilum TaxID=121039 RepID=UPI0023F122FA|nr:hypothetical protein [Ferrimicrobium acidiphilum]
MIEQKYGPQTAEVEEMIERIRTITPKQTKALKDAWKEAWEWTRGSAWSTTQEAVWVVLQHAGRDKIWSDAWVAVVQDGALKKNMGVAIEATWDAALALVARDLIPPELFNSLYEPWASAMEAKPH